MASQISAGRIQQQLSAIASGFLGDWLEHRGNGLAVPMSVFAGDKELRVEKPEPEAPGRTLCLSIHGLMELESVWDFPSRPGYHYGSYLAEQLGDVSALKLRFSTGRPIYRNGQELAALVDLLSHGVQHGAVNLQRVHFSVAEESFRILESVPVTRPGARVVRVWHHSISRLSYGSVAMAGQLVTTLTSRQLRERHDRKVNNS
ncbi:MULTISPECIES: hypothetical protein [Marinobacter]|uniref:hypothetical protein n=1 Tax=Marinobacter TaxID=2742 RepID=UPI001CFD2908|nr:hypothetical protein [Marinobacter nauticus]